MNRFQELLANPALTEALPEALVETLVMVGIAGVFTLVIGLALGVILHVTAPGGLRPVSWLHVLLSAVINVTRSIPYAILMVALIPFTAWLVGTSIGPIAACVSLTIGTAPFFARLVETSLREVPSGTVDAARVMGSTRGQIVRKVLLPEAMPGLVASITTTLVMLVGYSAMAGLIGGGGLGRLAYNYGYQRFQSEVMITTLVILVALVMIVQYVGDRLIRQVDHR